jgi:hypothetical protein
MELQALPGATTSRQLRAPGASNSPQEKGSIGALALWVPAVRKSQPGPGRGARARNPRFAGDRGWTPDPRFAPPTPGKSGVGVGVDPAAIPGRGKSGVGPPPPPPEKSGVGVGVGIGVISGVIGHCQPSQINELWQYN